jgi:sugar O-acyltransferase (sialic acid O-acetyltransferase NeuD family)
MDLYIFGTKRNSEMASFYFSRDYPHLDFCGYIEDSPTEQIAFGFPVISSAEFQKTVSPRGVVLFAPLTKGSARKEVFLRFKSLGYTFTSYVSPRAEVWDLSMVGENCYIQECNNIQYGTRFGDNCLFWAGNHIGHHGTIGSHVTFTSHCVLSGGCTIEDLCYFGVNSTIGDGITICANVFLGMGGTANKSITEEGIYVGSPVRRIRSSSDII